MCHVVSHCERSNRSWPQSSTATYCKIRAPAYDFAADKRVELSSRVALAYLGTTGAAAIRATRTPAFVAIERFALLALVDRSSGIAKEPTLWFPPAVRALIESGLHVFVALIAASHTALLPCTLISSLCASNWNERKEAMLISRSDCTPTTGSGIGRRESSPRSTDSEKRKRGSAS